MPTEKIRVLIIGAGEAGQLICNCINANKETSFNIVGFIDDNKSNEGKSICGQKVLGTINDLPQVIKQQKVNEVIIAIPSGRGDIIRRIVEKAVGLKIGFKILPRISEVLAQDFSKDYLRYLRKVQPEDLLGGEILKTDQKEIFSKVR